MLENNTVLTRVHVEESGWVCLVRGTRDAAGMVGQSGKLVPGLLLQLDQVVTSSMGDSCWPSVCMGRPMQAVCSSCSVETPHFTSAFLLSVSCRSLAVPTGALCCSGSLRATRSLFLTFLICCRGIFAHPYYRKGSLFTVFLCKIWSCLVVRTERLGSAGSPKFSSSFGHRLQLCAYML